jgi:hypothetical protein
VSIAPAPPSFIGGAARREHEEGFDMKRLIALGRTIAALLLPEFVIVAIIAAAVGICFLVFQLDSLPIEIVALAGLLFTVGLFVDW